MGISEAVAVNVGDLQKSTLRIKSSKTDQEGRGEVLYVGGPTLKLIDRYCTKADILSGALFRRIRRGDHVTLERLTVVSARRIIKARAQAAGMEGLISGHSLRGGSAVSPRWVLRWSICRMRAGGSRHRCRRIMPKRNWRNGERSQGSSMGRGSDTYAMDQQISQGLQSPVVGVFHCRSFCRCRLECVDGGYEVLNPYFIPEWTKAKMTEAEQQQNKEGENGWVQTEKLDL